MMLAHLKQAQELYEAAISHADGEDRPIDMERSVSFLKAATSKRHPGAAYELAWAFLKGEGGLSVDSVKALKLFRQGQRWGSADCALLLGEAYLHGKLGLPKNKKAAAKYLCRALMMGNARAAKCVAHFLDGDLPVATFRAELARLSLGNTRKNARKRRR